MAVGRSQAGWGPQALDTATSKTQPLPWGPAAPRGPRLQTGATVQSREPQGPRGHRLRAGGAGQAPIGPHSPPFASKVVGSAPQPLLPPSPLPWVEEAGQVVLLGNRGREAPSAAHLATVLDGQDPDRGSPASLPPAACLRAWVHPLRPGSDDAGLQHSGWGTPHRLASVTGKATRRRSAGSAQGCREQVTASVWVIWLSCRQARTPTTQACNPLCRESQPWRLGQSPRHHCTGPWPCSAPISSEPGGSQTAGNLSVGPGKQGH